VTDESLKRSKGWPANPSALGAQINDHIEPLLKVGIIVEANRSKAGRKKTIYKRRGK
jgi:hypothetical protein